MTLSIVLIILLVILILASILHHRYMQSRIDTEVYAKNQLTSKNAILSNENTELKNQMLSSNNDVSTHAKKMQNVKSKKYLKVSKEWPAKILRNYSD